MHEIDTTAELDRVDTLPEVLAQLYSRLQWNVHITRDGQILCAEGHTTTEFELFLPDKKLHTISFKPGLATATLKKAFRQTQFRRQVGLDLCPRCLVEDKMIKNGVV